MSAPDDQLKRRLSQTAFEDPEQAAFLGIIVLANQMTRALDAACAPHGITHAQYNVLRVLRGAGAEGHSRKEIARRLIEHSPDTTRFLDRLARAGLIERIPSTSDRRLSVARITAAGREVLAAADAGVAAVRHDFLGALPRADLAALTRTVVSALKEEEG